MADLSSITDFNGNTYDIKDAHAREEIEVRVPGINFLVPKSSSVYVKCKPANQLLVFSFSATVQLNGLRGSIYVTNGGSVTVYTDNAPTKLSMAYVADSESVVEFKNTNASSSARILIINANFDSDMPEIVSAPTA